MKDHRLGKRYAAALFGLAEAEGRLEEIMKELGETAELTQKHPEISYLLMNTTIAREEKEDFLEKILPQKTSSLLLNFLKVLIKKRRFQDFSLIREEFHKFYENKKGIQRVRVQTTVSLNEKMQDKLRRALEKKLKKDILLETEVHPEILGGMVLDFEGTQIDGSFRTALHELKQKLLNP